MRLVEQSTAGTDLTVLTYRVAEVVRHQPVGVLGEDGPSLRGNVVEGSWFGHRRNLRWDVSDHSSTIASALCASCKNRHDSPASIRRCTSLPFRNGVAKRS